MPTNCDADSFSLGIRSIDEVFLTIQGERHDLWRAVDQDGNTLDILVQRRRDKKAAKTFFRKLLKRGFWPVICPRRINVCRPIPMVKAQPL
jgi:transposase-like protein